MYKLIGKDGKLYESELPGLLGGHRKLKIYGRLDCPSALRHIEKGHYVKHRVFFIDEETAIAAGYRPCAICMKDAYLRWKEKMLSQIVYSLRRRQLHKNNAPKACQKAWLRFWGVSFLNATYRDD